MSYQHRFYGRFPLVLWTLEQTSPPAGIVASGWSLTRERAWRASIAWIDALPSSLERHLARP